MPLSAVITEPVTLSDPNYNYTLEDDIIVEDQWSGIEWEFTDYSGENVSAVLTLSGETRNVAVSNPDDGAVALYVVNNKEGDSSLPLGALNIIPNSTDGTAMLKFSAYATTYAVGFGTDISSPSWVGFDFEAPGVAVIGTATASDGNACVFGVDSVDDFSKVDDWRTAFGSGTVLSAMATAKSGNDAYAATLGVPGAGWEFIHGWTACFSGNADLSALAYAAENGTAQATTLSIENGTFWFSSEEGEAEPTVNLLAGNLTAPWEKIEGGFSGTLAAENWNEIHNYVFPAAHWLWFGNSFTESNVLLLNIPGTANIIGAGTAKGIYIANNWTVNAFGPIKVNKVLTIYRGKLVLWGDNEAGNAQLDNALSNTKINVADGTDVYSGTLSRGEYTPGGKLILEQTVWDSWADFTFGGMAHLVSQGDQKQIQEWGYVECQGNSSGDPQVVFEGEQYLATGVVNEEGEEASATELADASMECVLFSGATKDLFGGMVLAEEPTATINENKYYEITQLGGEAPRYGIENDYAKAENIGLYFVEGQGITLSTLEGRLILNPSEYSRDYINAELATSLTNVNRMIYNSLDSQMNDLKSNGNDPFVAVLSAHSHQDEIAGFGYSDNAYGILLGEDVRWSLGNERYLKCGIAGAFANSKMDFFGAATALGKNSRQDMYIGGIFASYEQFNKKYLKTNLTLMTGMNYARNKMTRTDNSKDFYRADFDSINAFLSASAIKNCYAYRGWQIGPWLSATYNYVHQQGYTETSATGSNAVQLSSINQNLFDFIAGVNLEKEWQHQQKADARLRTYARVGWRCQPIRSHSTGEARISGLNPFAPEFGYAERNGFVAQLGLRNKLDQNWEWSANYAADISGNYRYQNLNLSVGYTF